MNQKNLVLNALRNNSDGVSAKTFTGSYRIGNVYEVVRKLREEGHAIYGNKTANGVKYRLGNPSRGMVAAAARIYGASMFS